MSMDESKVSVQSVVGAEAEERQDNDLLESCLGAGGQLLGLAGSDEDSREA